MRRRGIHAGTLTLGEAFSFEDVLTVITVLLLLRIVFMVPLVNLDKAKTIASKSDRYWSLEALHVLAHPSAEAMTAPYRAAFGLQEAAISLTSVDGAVYIEAAEADSNLMVIRHDPETSGFIALRVQGQGHTRNFRRGRLLWSRTEKEWFVGSDTLDYGSHPSSKALEESFRHWTKSMRGY